MQGILIVSDSPAFVDSALDAIRPLGLRAVVHAKGSGLAVAVAEARADLVVLDAGFADLDVMMACYFLRKWRPRLAIMVLTHDDTDPDAIELYAASAHACMALPVAPADFAGAVARHLPQPGWLTFLPSSSPMRSLA